MRRANDPRKKDFSPTELDFGDIKFYLARHFGFCYGVENAISISYKALDENPGRRIYLVSQIIHNPQVNADLTSRGVRFILDTAGQPLIPWGSISPDDVVIIPAFGAMVETEQHLERIGVDVRRYDTTCPFVQKVWNRAGKLGEEGYTAVIHGKREHEETRSTLSRSAQKTPCVVVRNMKETQLLGDFIVGLRPLSDFSSCFGQNVSDGFHPAAHLVRIGVVNQTTMLATETQAIIDYLRNLMAEKYGVERVKNHFADTRDTLCYATNDNQDAVYGLLEKQPDVALIVGGYNSSNTFHIATLCERKIPTYLIHSHEEIRSRNEIRHFDLHRKEPVITPNFIPAATPLCVGISSGASCPDTLVDRVILRMVSFFRADASMAELMEVVAALR